MPYFSRGQMKKSYATVMTIEISALEELKCKLLLGRKSPSEPRTIGFETIFLINLIVRLRGLRWHW